MERLFSKWSLIFTYINMTFNSHSRDNDEELKKWAKRIKTKAGFACEICGKKGVFLNSHHLNSWADYPEERYDDRNGASLCLSCHDALHYIYGFGKNTKEQFNEFKSTMETLKKIARNKIIK